MFLIPFAKSMKSLGYTCLLMLLFYAAAISAQSVTTSGYDTTTDQTTAVNSNATGNDVKQEINKIVLCMKKTKVIGAIVNNIINFSNWIIILFPNLRNYFITYLNRLIVICIQSILLLNEWIKWFKTYAWLFINLSSLSRQL